MKNVKARKGELQAAWSDTPWEDIAAYIGPNAERFRSAWEKQRTLILTKGSGFGWTFCWPALVLSYVWFFYRKQWALGSILLVLPAVITVAYPAAAGGLAGMGIAFGMMAKGFYLLGAVSKITKIRAKLADDAARKTALAAAGGTSKLAGIISGIVFALSVAAVIMSATR